MGQIPWYNPRDTTIAELLMRQGDAQARAAATKGALWADAAQNIGNIAAQATTAVMEQKDQKKREAQLDAALSTFDPQNPMDFYRRTAVAVGPEAAMRVTTGMAAMMKLQQGAQPDPKDAAVVVGGLAALEEKTPGYLTKNWATVGPAVAPIAKIWGMPLDPTTPPEDFGQQLLALNTALNKKDEEGALVETVDANGRPIKRWATAAELRAGVPMVTKAGDVPAAGSFEAFVVGKYGDKPTPEQMIAARSEWARADDKPRDPLAAALAQSRIDALKDKDTETKAEVESYVNAVGRGDYTIDKVPTTIQKQVMVEAEKRGLDTRTAAQKEIDAGAEQTIESLKQLREQATKTMTATTGPGAKVQGAAQRGLSWVGLAEETQAWDKQMGKLALLARQLGEKGVLSNFDVDRVTNLLPKLTEKASLRDKALKNVEDIIFTGLRGKVSGRVKLPGSEAAQVEVTAPNGRVYRFPSQEQADAAKKAWGMP